MEPGIASSLPAAGTPADMPMISDPGAAIQAVVEFFESRQVLMREDFLRLLKKSQTKGWVSRFQRQNAPSRMSLKL